MLENTSIAKISEGFNFDNENTVICNVSIGKTTTSRDSTTTYSCPSGYTLNGTKCYKN